MSQIQFKIFFCLLAFLCRCDLLQNINIKAILKIEIILPLSDFINQSIKLAIILFFWWLDLNQTDSINLNALRKNPT